MTNPVVLLAHYTEQPRAECARVLEAQQGHFWKALYALTRPETPKARYIYDLDPDQPETALQALRGIRSYYVNEAYINAWVETEDEDLHADYLEFEELAGRMEIEELKAYQKILEKSSGGDLVMETLGMLYFWKRDLPEEMLELIRRFIGHYDADVSRAAIRLLTAFPNTVECFLPEIATMLDSDEIHEDHRYDVMWVLWTVARNGIHFPQLRKYYKRFRDIDYIMIRVFCRDPSEGRAKLIILRILGEALDCLLVSYRSAYKSIPDNLPARQMAHLVVRYPHLHRHIS